MFPLKSTTANKRCMLLQKWQVSIFGRYSIGCECRECLLKFMIPKLQEMSFHFIPRRGEWGCAAFVTVEHPWCRLYSDEGNRRETVPPSPTNSSRKYCMKSPQVLSIFQPSLAKKKTSVTTWLDASCCDIQQQHSPKMQNVPPASHGGSATS